MHIAMRPGPFALQIPAHYLTPRRQTGVGVICEPAILVKRRGSAATIRQQVRGLHEIFTDSSLIFSKFLNEFQVLRIGTNIGF